MQPDDNFLGKIHVVLYFLKTSHHQFPSINGEGFMNKRFLAKRPFMSAWLMSAIVALPCLAIEISGYTTGTGHYVIEANYRPASESLAGLSIRMQIDPTNDVSVVTADAPSVGAWSQIKPELFRSSTNLSLSALAPTIMISNDTSLTPIFSVTIAINNSLASLTHFSQLVDSVIIDKALTPDGSAATAQLVLLDNITAVTGRPGAAQLSLDIKYRTIGQRHSISFNIAKKCHVRARIADMQGRMMRTLDDRIMEAGIHTIGWDGKNAHGSFTAAGIYFLTLEAGSSTFSKKIILAR